MLWLSCCSVNPSVLGDRTGWSFVSNSIRLEVRLTRTSKRDKEGCNCAQRHSVLDSRWDPYTGFTFEEETNVLQASFKQLNTETLSQIWFCWLWCCWLRLHRFECAFDGSITALKPARLQAAQNTADAGSELIAHLRTEELLFVWSLTFVSGFRSLRITWLVPQTGHKLRADRA